MERFKAVISEIKSIRESDKHTGHMPGEVRSLHLATLSVVTGLVAIWCNYIASAPTPELAVISVGSFAVSGTAFAVSEISRHTNPYPFSKDLK
jgi:hypothetical protein